MRSCLSATRRVGWWPRLRLEILLQLPWPDQPDADDDVGDHSLFPILRAGCDLYTMVDIGIFFLKGDLLHRIY